MWFWVVLIQPIAIALGIVSLIYTILVFKCIYVDTL